MTDAAPKSDRPQERIDPDGPPGLTPGVEAPWAVAAEGVLASLHTGPDGLGDDEAERRRARYGPNVLRQAPPRSAWQVLAAQFRSLLVVLLASAAALSAAFGQWVEALAIVVVLALNAAIGFTTELRAVRSMEALRRLGRVRATVRRAGRAITVEADALVPGDIVLVEGGDVVTADLRILQASKMQANESALTGESLPVGKQTQPVASDAPLAERSSMLYKGTSISRGSGEGVVIATGMETELGRISQLVAEATDETTPLEKRLDRLGQRLVWFTLAVAGVIAVIGLATGEPWLLILETSIALAVATVPEGLPIIATITLARGMHRMAEHNALVNRLSAVETLGATSVVFTDKTGTLTENRMSVESLWLPRGRATLSYGRDGGFALDGTDVEAAQLPELHRALVAAALCNNASLGPDPTGVDGRGVGDPLELALLEAASRAGIDRGRLLRDLPEVREVAFDPDTTMMATVHREADTAFGVAVKGAPEVVLEACSRVAAGTDDRPLAEDERQRWLGRNEALASEGLRVLALASTTLHDADDDPYHDLTLLGLVALRDPPRADVREAIDACKLAGIRVVMVTGDQPITAASIAESVGLTEARPRVVTGREMETLTSKGDDHAWQTLVEADILARVSPEQKLEIIRHYQDRGAIVAMTGDGVNDAPALKKADIGVAMELRGTEVAREAADMVLKDDAFGTIVEAVRRGRIIFDDIRAFVLYLLSCNLSEVLVIGIASALGGPLPLLPLQILFLNLVTDVFPALALGASEGSPGVLSRPPRDPAEPVLAARHWRRLIGYALAITIAVLGAFALALGPLQLERSQAVTVSFLTLAFAQLWHVFDMRGPGSGWLVNEITRNPWVWGALALCTALLLGAAAVPGASALLSIAALEPSGWALVAGASLAPLLLGQLARWLGIDRGA